MDIQNLVRERVIGNIKTGTKGENGLPKKLPYFNVEEDKATSSEMVDIFKQLYPGKPTSLKIMFTSENPFKFQYKRYVNNKAVCIGNDSKAITIGKDSKNRNTQIEIECNEDCEQRRSGKCKLVGSLKFVLVGIEAGGVWKINTSGGFSLSNIASEIIKYKKAEMSIVNVPFELSLTEQESLAYGTYYSLDLHRTDIKPQLVGDAQQTVKQIALSSKQESKQLPEGEKENKKDSKKDKTQSKSNEQNANEETKQEEKENYLIVKKFIPIMVGNNKIDKIIFEDINFQEVEYFLHPKADKDILNFLPGSVIIATKTKVEAAKNILCTYEVKEAKYRENTTNNELKEAV